MSRSVRGIELTAAGRAFLDHARLALAQVEAAREAARRAAEPAKQSFALGFLTGQEMDWLPEAMRILRDELPNMEVTVSSQYSPQLADALRRGILDVAFMRPEAQRLVTKEQLVAVLPSDHRLAAFDAIDPHDIVGETFVHISEGTGEHVLTKVESIRCKHVTAGTGRSCVPIRPPWCRTGRAHSR
jgi:LysR family hca operon transcriptional activator